MNIADILKQVLVEYDHATANYPAFASAHEGYAVLLEEVDELWAEVKVKQCKHDHDRMRAEAIQIAAMAVRFAMDVCSERPLSLKDTSR